MGVHVLQVDISYERTCLTGGHVLRCLIGEHTLQEEMS